MTDDIAENLRAAALAASDEIGRLKYQAVLDIRMRDEIVAALTSALRGEVISGHYQPNQLSGTKIVRHSCDLCGAYWQPGDPEFHMDKCVLSKVPHELLSR